MLAIVLATVTSLCDATAFEAIASNARGRVGAAAAIVESGEVVEYHAAEAFPMQSVYKVPIAMAALERVAKGSLQLRQRVDVLPEDLVPRPGHSPIRDANPRGRTMTIEQLIDYAVRISDGTASDVLLRLTGGPQAVNEYLRRIGVAGINIATTEAAQLREPRLQYQNSATPAAMVHLLTALHRARGITTTHRALLLRLMEQTNTGPRRLKGLLPHKTIVAHKTGTSGTHGGITAATNDAGLITLPDGRHLAIAVFVSDSKADARARDAVVANVARLAWDGYSRGRLCPKR